jgi:gliding motility-associated-like protein
VSTVPPPLAPLINGVSSYCQGVPFVPFTVTAYTGSLLWYTTPTGGVGSGIAPVVNTLVPGVTTVYVSQIIGTCESPRASFTVRVTTTPPAPRVTGRMEYCQFLGPFEPHTIITTVSGVARWYTTPTGGSPMPGEPTPNLNVATTYNYYVSQIDSACEGPRTLVRIIVHPKPAPPTVTHQVYCQYKPAVPLIARPSTPGNFLLWFGDGIVSTGTPSTPTPNTSIPGVDTFYVNETSAFGCVSEKTMDTVRVIPKPIMPHTVDTTYCQFQSAVSLNNQTDSSNFSRLYWYLGGVELNGTPTPSTLTPGKTTWYVGQSVSGCRSDSVALSVTTLFLPKFDIVATSPWVCQFDSITLSYKGPALVDPGYFWTLAKGDSLVHNSKITDSSIMVAFDSATKNNFIVLRTSNNGGRCFSSDTISINVIPQPVARSYSKSDVCLGDTVALSLAYKTDNSVSYVWKIDYLYQLNNAPMLNVISHNSNSGGPFLISWLDTGRHVIQVNTTSKEGCKSESAYDSINVHNVPDATFQYVLRPGALCLEDSVLFIANNKDYRNKFFWTPEHAFNNININEAQAWGRVENDRSIITLQITNPFGCEATSSLEINPGSCCTISMPNAFTPNGDGRNDFYQPLFQGYHRFHVFRITNRWGQTVFESSQNQMKWDGTLDGVPQDMGVYFYYIKYDCGGEKLEQSGDVTLIR